MAFDAEPIHIVPRMLPRRWGKGDTHAWCPGAPRPQAPIGEVWLAHANNITSEGDHLGARIANAPQTILGDLGRAPPSLRLVLTDEPSDAILSEGTPSLWSILQAPLDGMVCVGEYDGLAERQVRARRGDVMRAEPGARLRFCPGIVAIEARAHFSPRNTPTAPYLKRLPRVAGAHGREVWLRDAALSVERWTLPNVSLLSPNGETCHVLVSLTPGVMLDGKPMQRGDTVLLPAEGRQCVLTGCGGEMLVAYPDLAPTAIWTTGRPPRPAARAMATALASFSTPTPRAKSDLVEKRAA